MDATVAVVFLRLLAEAVSGVSVAAQVAVAEMVWEMVELVEFIGGGS